MFHDFKKSMMEEFDMTDLGMMHFFLGIEVIQSAAGIFITQKKYALEVLEKFEMKNCNSVAILTEPGLKLVKNPKLGSKLANDPKSKKVDSTFFKQIVGILMYLTATRLDIMFAVSLISRFMEHPTEQHILAAKNVLRYLKGTIDFGIFYKKGEMSELVGFTDSDYAGDVNDRRSTSGYVFMMGSEAISWSSKKQQVVSLSTTEAEFIAGASCACQAVWLRRMLGELNFPQVEATAVYCDNSSTIKLSKNPVLHGRSKHIDVRCHFLHDLTKDGIIELVHCKSEDQIANILTKPLKVATFMRL